MNATSFAQLSAGSLHATSTTQQLPLGTLMYSRDGRGFRYCQNAATLLVVGNHIQAAVQNTAFQGLTPSAASVGDLTVTITPGATTGVANLFAEGVVQVSVTPDLGNAYEIQSHPAIASTTAFAARLYQDEALRVAWTSSTRVDLIQNPYKNVVQSPTTATGALVGVCISPIPASTTTVFQYGWLQTHGHGCLLVAGTPGVGIGVGYSATAGAAAVLGATLAQTGIMMVTGQAGLTQAVYLTID